MIVALILLVAIVGTGAVLYLEQRLHMRRKASAAPTETQLDDKAPDATEEECCGMHITCERDSLLAAVSTQVEYYDDEELDRFAGRPQDDYNDAEIEEFRDVLLTMQPDDIAGWARSLQLRSITLPQIVRDELLMIVGEARQSRAHVAVS